MQQAGGSKGRDAPVARLSAGGDAPAGRLYMKSIAVWDAAGKTIKA
jgi:hypothetical protein